MSIEDGKSSGGSSKLAEIIEKKKKQKIVEGLTERETNFNLLLDEVLVSLVDDEESKTAVAEVVSEMMDKLAKLKNEDWSLTEMETFLEELGEVEAQLRELAGIEEKVKMGDEEEEKEEEKLNGEDLYNRIVGMLDSKWTEEAFEKYIPMVEEMSESELDNTRKDELRKHIAERFSLIFNRDKTMSPLTIKVFFGKHYGVYEKFLEELAKAESKESGVDLDALLKETQEYETGGDRDLDTLLNNLEHVVNDGEQKIKMILELDEVKSNVAEAHRIRQEYLNPVEKIREKIVSEITQKIEENAEWKEVLRQSSDPDKKSFAELKTLYKQGEQVTIETLRELLARGTGLGQKIVEGHPQIKNEIKEILDRVLKPVEDFVEELVNNEDYQKELVMRNESIRTVLNHAITNDTGYSPRKETAIWNRVKGVLEQKIKALVEGGRSGWSFVDGEGNHNEAEEKEWQDAFKELMDGVLMATEMLLLNTDNKDGLNYEQLTCAYQEMIKKLSKKAYFDVNNGINFNKFLWNSADGHRFSQYEFNYEDYCFKDFQKMQDYAGPLAWIMYLCKQAMCAKGGKADKSLFSYANGGAKGDPEKYRKRMVDAICAGGFAKEGGALIQVDKYGQKIEVDMVEKLSHFPPELVEILKEVAVALMARDNFGLMANLYCQKQYNTAMNMDTGTGTAMMDYEALGKTVPYVKGTVPDMVYYGNKGFDGNWAVALLTTNLTKTTYNEDGSIAYQPPEHEAIDGTRNKSLYQLKYNTAQNPDGTPNPDAANPVHFAYNQEAFTRYWLMSHPARTREMVDEMRFDMDDDLTDILDIQQLSLVSDGDEAKSGGGGNFDAALDAMLTIRECCVSDKNHDVGNVRANLRAIGTSFSKMDGFIGPYLGPTPDYSQFDSTQLDAAIENESNIEKRRGIFYNYVYARCLSYTKFYVADILTSFRIEPTTHSDWRGRPDAAEGRQVYKKYDDKFSDMLQGIQAEIIGADEGVSGNVFKKSWGREMKDFLGDGERFREGRDEIQSRTQRNNEQREKFVEMVHLMPEQYTSLFNGNIRAEIKAMIQAGRRLTFKELKAMFATSTLIEIGNDERNLTALTSFYNPFRTRGKWSSSNSKVEE